MLIVIYIKFYYFNFNYNICNIFREISIGNEIFFLLNLVDRVCFMIFRKKNNYNVFNNIIFN